MKNVLLLSLFFVSCSLLAASPIKIEGKTFISNYSYRIDAWESNGIVPAMSGTIDLTLTNENGEVIEFKRVGNMGSFVNRNVIYFVGNNYDILMIIGNDALEEYSISQLAKDLTEFIGKKVSIPNKLAQNYDTVIALIKNETVILDTAKSQVTER